ncbi:pentapeptide repeat-containing protein [Neoroseomonas oryzicola]|uniref:Tetratricopeptide repeat protein n=2 Tax=Neoroseomonas oryzicola TaxID=535904 RepID=A0A9X9WLL8_9PROT|nr:pentapeptide repeat-containing protein [Neoroseomonas oryzicola]MBR0661228.1 tetratricopeptide repeat protein [Neoroseomonas oryzicola]
MPELAVMERDLVFRGRVVAVEENDDGAAPRTQRTTFEVLQVWKGALPDRVVVRTNVDSASCGTTFSVGDEETVFGSRHRGEIGTGYCSRWHATSASPVLHRLGEQLSAADDAVRAAPGTVAPVLARARLLRFWRDHERALTAYREIVDTFPDLADPQVGMARVLTAQGRPDEALALLEGARARLGPHPDILAAMGVARVAVGDLSDLQRVDFREADLSGLNLSGHDLRGADFSGAYLARVSLTSSDLRGARFEDTRFNSVNMSGVDLRGSRFVGSTGFPAVRRADLRDAHLERIAFPRGVSFREADMTGATIMESRLVEPLFGDTRLAHARLTTVYIRGASIVNPNFAGATLRDVTFAGGAVYRTATGSQGSPLRVEDLAGAHLTNVRIEARSRLTAPAAPSAPRP